MHTGLAALALYTLLLGTAALAEDAKPLTITGQVTVKPELAGQVAPSDRLILKLYVPEGGIEKDLKFVIVPTAKLPHEFKIGPSVDMNGNTRFSAYRVEVFTDKDNDIEKIAPGELQAMSTDLVPLGATGMVLELDRARQ